MIVIRLLLTFNTVRMGPGRECGWRGGPKDNPPLRESQPAKETEAAQSEGLEENHRPGTRKP